MRTANALAAAIFALAALVQLNDPDPLLWICVYTAAAMICLRGWLALPQRRLCALMLVVASLWATSLAPQVIGKVSFSALFQELAMNSQAVEAGREMGGLMLVALWMLANLISTSKYEHSQDEKRDG